MPNAGSGDGVAGNTPSNQGGQRADMQQGTTGNFKGGGGNHKHPSTYQTAKGPLQTTHSLNVKYVDMIMCRYNGFTTAALLLILDLDQVLFYYVSDVTRSYNCCKQLSSRN